MIKSLIQNKYPLVWIILHLILGFTATITPYVLIAWFYFVILSSLSHVLKKNKSPFILISLLLYLVSFELLSRMARTSPFIPYELGKYLLAAGAIWGIFNFKTRGYSGIVMLVCLLPSLFIDLSGQVQRSDVVFNLLGAVNVALVCWFFYKQNFSSEELGKVVRLMVYPILGILSYTFIKTPDFEEVEFVLGANVDLSGGFGSNQVSTLFGLGTLLVFILIISRQTFSGNFILDIAILFALSFQGLLTFSRGGMIGAVLGVMIILFFLRRASPLVRRKYHLPNVGKYVIPLILVGILSFVVVDQITNGLLSLRYQGETMGTIQGSKVKTLNTISTGRFDIFMGDVNLWLDHFVFGVGAGASRFLRESLTGTIAHVELSRLLAESGFLGLIYFVILSWLGVKLFRGQSNPLIKGILIALYIVAMYTTFHAAMRTYVTPSLLGLSLLAVKTSKKPKPKVRKKHSLKALEPIAS
ncbi:O-antigen ligase family protein [Algoriphagus sediminis]|uniref:O-antigen ligase family protein n=1 Tax=Algoriphagus sediminis TaxID=3057113 RepID=A0ABT7YDY1_9BACT|nr:O-antigen ligase family protein [Algoriphagus sediminis]MDN3204737.1 O-antigen ligase family protein [Algoriphagus sediminis]